MNPRSHSDRVRIRIFRSFVAYGTCVPTVPTLSVYLCAVCTCVPSVPVCRPYLCAICTSVPSVPLCRLYLCADCISVPTVSLCRLYLCADCILLYLTVSYCILLYLTVGAASSRDGVPMTNHEAHQINLRRGQFSQSGQYYFITASTKGRLPVFSDPAASKIVLDSLRWLDDQGRIALVTAVVMPDHIHFAARLLTTTLPSLVHSLKSFTSNEINELYGRQGPVWEPHYYDHAIRSEGELTERVYYCLQNPVRKGLVNHFKEYPHWYCAYEV